jgi:hypothetical protein
MPASATNEPTARRLTRLVREGVRSERPDARAVAIVVLEAPSAATLAADGELA